MSATRKNSPRVGRYAKGQVIATFGKQSLIETTNSETLSCVMRGKKGGIACGDQVEIQLTAPRQGVIETIKPRSTLLYRSDTFKEKTLAANVTQIIIVVAAVPSFSEELINRCLVAAENQRIKALILLNKADLSEPTLIAAATLSLYQKLGYPLIQISAKKNIAALLPYLTGHFSVLTGQSGMGKSTLINTLIPEAKRATAEISAALDSGCHTTTHSRLYHLNLDSHIIDSPGLQEFGLNHIKHERLAWEFIEFHPFIGHCKFNDCRHLDEPNCALKLAVEKGEISARRFAFYHKIYNSISLIKAKTY